MPVATALTSEQKEKWDRDGYLILPQFFGTDIVDPINGLIERLSHRNARSNEMAGRVVVDLLAGSAHRRMRLADAPDEAFERPVKFNDLFLECDVIRNCNLHPRLVPILDELLDGPPVVCNSLNFIQGSEQTEHIDSWFMPPPAPEKMVVTSVCLEDVHPEAGPLFYLPGSQKIPPYLFSNGTIRAIPAEMDKCHAYLDKAIDERGIGRETFLGRKGDVFIWSCQIAHGGTPIKDPKRTRKSLVTHYWRANDMARHKLEGGKRRLLLRQGSPAGAVRSCVEAARGPRLARGALGRAAGEAGGGAAGALMAARRRPRLCYHAGSRLLVLLPRAMTSPAIGHGPPTTLELFTPKLVTVFREGYGLADLRADALAGLTVAIVALPLSMAIAIASGVGPERGLYTAIVGGFLVSLLGGSRVQIGGPAGAFIVLVAAVVQRHGYDGLVLATMMAGAIMALIGFLRLGSYIKFIPYPVTVGFTAGIAAIILVSQLKDLFGLQVAHEPAEFLPKLGALWEAAGSVRPATVAVALAALVFILVLRRVRPHWPGFLIVVVLGAAAAALGLDVATIGSRFGGIPSMLPAPVAARLQPGEDAGGAARRARDCAPGIDRVAPVRRGRGRAHRPAPSVELRARRAGRGEYRLGDIRRHLRHRHHRADRHERSGRRTRTDRRDVPRALRAAVHGDRRAARVVRAAGGAWRDPDRRRLEHVRERRVHRAAQVLARRCGRSARDLPAHGVRRSADRDRSRRRCRLISCSCIAWRKPSRSKAVRSLIEDQADTEDVSAQSRTE